LRGYPRWAGHPAQRFLKLDVDAGKHKEMQPKQLRMTRPESSRHQKSFWMNKGKKGQKSQLSAAAAQKTSGSS
jgi:hypothetical protein